MHICWCLLLVAFTDSQLQCCLVVFCTSAHRNVKKWHYHSWTAVPISAPLPPSKDGVMKQVPGEHDWNVSNSSQRWRPILPPDWEQRADDSEVKTDCRDSDWGWQTERGGNEITLSLIHCCLLSDLIWPCRHTWAKSHPSQVLWKPSLLTLSSSFILSSLSFSMVDHPSYHPFISRLFQSHHPSTSLFRFIPLSLLLHNTVLSFKIYML